MRKLLRTFAGLLVVAFATTVARADNVLWIDDSAGNIGTVDLTTKAVRKNYFSNLDDDDGAKWSSSNPARPSEA